MKEDKITEIIEETIKSKNKIRIKDKVDFRMKFDDNLNILNKLTLKEDGKRRNKK